MKMFFKLLFLSICFYPLLSSHVFASETIWKIQSIDTMKYSRDSSRNPAVKKIIPIHVKAVANTGANYIAIDTPYDDEFIPILTLWVSEARKNNLKVWFRGNFSGWEGWFEYSKLSSAREHITKTYRFITQNPTLFENGDLFTPAPEPENGILGDPRRTGKKEEFNTFLLDSYDSCMNAFSVIQKKIDCGIWSMNTDVLRETVSKDTIKKMGSVISIDHYTKTPEKLVSDVKVLAEKFAAHVVLGEFGAPIPDINGVMTESEQATHLEKILEGVYRENDIVLGMNYWVIFGGSTTLYNTNSTPRKAVASIQKYFKPVVIAGRITEENSDKTLAGVEIQTKDSYSSAKTDKNGNFELLVPDVLPRTEILASKSGYISSNVVLSLKGKRVEKNFALKPVETGVIFKLKKFTKDVVESISDVFR